MPDSCPHCGASLPAVGDAFCPTCRQALEDIPIVEVVPAQKSRPAPEVKSVAVPALLSSKRWLFVAASIIVLGVILVALSTLDFHWPRIVVASGEPLVVSAEELRADFQRDPEQARRHYVGRDLTVTGIVLSVPFSFDKTGATEWEYVVTSSAGDPNEFPWIRWRVPTQANPPPW